MLKKRIATLAAAAMIAVTAFAGVLPTGLQMDTSITASAASTVKMKVTLDANGGSCSKSKITVTYGKKYGTLPTPTRSGYNFVGWYNSSGSKVTASTVCKKKSAHTLTAKWKKWPTSVTLTFNANGGTVSSSTITYYSGEKIGTLPTASKSGYTFLGWYTKKSGGTKINKNTVLSVVKNRTFYAHYAVKSTVTLDANGGSCSKSKITVTYSKKYGTLPTPTRSGYNFVGWYNSSGSKVTASTVCKKKSAHTLTAKWKAWPTSVTLTFDGNGGTASSTSKTYYSGKKMGTLPTASKSGYYFIGWYTKKSGGTKINKNTVLSVVKNRTFYAHYTSYFTVTLDANGGSCSKSSITGAYTKTYGTLPTPTRSGYNFVGWYNSNGSKVTSSTVCKKKTAHTLTAKWEAWPTSVTLTFDANGGTATSTSKTYYSGKIMGALPSASKTGYTFKGWYTQKTGGTRITYYTVLTNVTNRTFYAQYDVASFSTLKYSFNNTYEGFGYSRTYRIPYERYSYMFSEQYANFVYSVVGMTAWGGNCYGMSSTSALFNTGKVKVQSFNSKQYFIKGLSLTDESSTYGITVNEFIESMQVAQYAPSLQDAFEEHLEDYSTLVSKVKACQSGTGQPVVIGMIEGNAGHAVLAYSWKKISSTEERIYIYDCNDNSSAKYITLYKSNGSYTGFEYDSYTSFTWYSFSEIYSVWTNRGTTANGTISSLSVSVDNARIYDENGTLCAVISDGEFTSYDDDVYQTISFDVSLTSTLICLPEGDYTVVNTEDEDMSVAMYADGTTCSAQSDADAITLSVDAETVTVYDEDSADYEITLYTSSGDVTVSGSTDSGTYEVSEDKITEITDDESQLSELVG